jgi:hypothetical protein
LTTALHEIGVAAKMPARHHADMTHSTMLRISGIAFGLLLTACAGAGPGLTGNDTGGIIPYANFDRPQAMAMATGHCARYGKLAKATGVDARYGGYYSFSCVIDRRVRE